MATKLRESERVGKLHAFRISDIPDSIRMKHAMKASASLVQHNLSTKLGVAPTHEEGWTVLMQSVLIVRNWVVAPSQRTYRVPQKAWDAMIAEAEKLDRELAKRAIVDA